MIGRCTHRCSALAALVIAIFVATIGSAYAESLGDRHQKNLRSARRRVYVYECRSQYD
jgi:hypothetical protein